MNGFLNLGLSFWEVLALLAAAVAAIVVVRLTVTFDLNRYLENRRSSFTQKLRNACLHFRFVPGGSGRIQVQAFWVSPPGTLAHHCKRCGAETYLDQDEYTESVNYYSKHLSEYRRMNKRFARLLKQSGQV